MDKMNVAELKIGCRWLNRWCLLNWYNAELWVCPGKQTLSMLCCFCIYFTSWAQNTPPPPLRFHTRHKHSVKTYIYLPIRCLCLCGCLWVYCSNRKHKQPRSTYLHYKPFLGLMLYRRQREQHNRQKKKLCLTVTTTRMDCYYAVYIYIYVKLWSMRH